MYSQIVLILEQNIYSEKNLLGRQHNGIFQNKKLSLQSHTLLITSDVSIMLFLHVQFKI